MILNRTLWKHGRRATLHNIEVQAFNLRNVMDWNIFACFFYSLSYPQRWMSQLVKDVDRKDDHITIYSPEKGLRVTLSSSMIKMEHHPCVSFFLLAWRQGCHISWFIAEYKVSICCEELLMHISCVPLKLFTIMNRNFRHIALQARHQLHMCVLAKNTGTLRFYDMCNCYHMRTIPH